MKTIPQEYSRKGFIYKLIERDGDYAVYQVQKVDFKTFLGFEVCIVRKHKADNEFLHVKAGDEYLPGTNEWGRLGWTVQSLGAARLKVAKLKEKKICLDSTKPQE